MAADGPGLRPVRARKGDVVEVAPGTVNLMTPKLRPTRSTLPWGLRRVTICVERVPGDEEVHLLAGAAAQGVPDRSADGVDIGPEQPDEKCFFGEI